MVSTTKETATESASETSTMRIGEFLVERGLLSEQQTLTVLIEQQRRQRPVIELLMHPGGLTSRQALQIAEHASSALGDPLDLAQHLNLLSADQLAAIRAHQVASKPPFVQVAVELGLAESGMASAWLRRFFAYLNGDVELSNDDSDGKPPRGAGALSNAEQINTLAKAATELPHTVPLTVESTAIDDYVASLSDDVRNRIDKTLLQIEQGPREEAKALLDLLYRELHSLKGSAGFLGALASQKVLHGMEDCLSVGKTHLTILEPGELSQGIELVFQGLDLLWGLAATIAKEHDETPFLRREGERYGLYIVHMDRLLAVLSERITLRLANVSVSDMF